MDGTVAWKSIEWGSRACADRADSRGIGETLMKPYDTVIDDIIADSREAARHRDDA